MSLFYIIEGTEKRAAPSTEQMRTLAREVALAARQEVGLLVIDADGEILHNSAFLDAHLLKRDGKFEPWPSPSEKPEDAA